MDLRAALTYFRDRSDYDRGFISNPFAGDEAAQLGLRRTRNLLDALGAPDRAYPIIHVAGTKGKGSTCAFIEAVALARGLPTGMFVTPHLHSVLERTRIEGESITEQEFARLMGLNAAAAERVETENPRDGTLTAFEISTAMSLLAFAEAGVELAIVEVGLGGRLDATNVIEPSVSVITPVSFDHEAILGNTLAEIASEKAGIVRTGVPFVSAPQEPDALQTLLATAARLNAPLALSGSDWTVAYEGGLSTLSGPWGRLNHVRLGLRGAHQSENAGVALMALWQHQPDLLDDPEALRKALESTRWPGRFEQLGERPAIIADGAHNIASMRALKGALRETFGDARFVVVFGSYRDKDLTGMLTVLKKLSPTIVATRSRSPRARTSDEVRHAAVALDLTAMAASTVEGALQRAAGIADAADVIVVTGSLSVVAEAREALGLGQVSALEREILHT